MGRGFLEKPTVPTQPESPTSGSETSIDRRLMLVRPSSIGLE